MSQIRKKQNAKNKQLFHKFSADMKKIYGKTPQEIVDERKKLKTVPEASVVRNIQI